MATRFALPDRSRALTVQEGSVMTPIQYDQHPYSFMNIWMETEGAVAIKFDYRFIKGHNSSRKDLVMTSIYSIINNRWL